jgi:hypothetical protein
MLFSVEEFMSDSKRGSLRNLKIRIVTPTQIIEFCG